MMTSPYNLMVVKELNGNMIRNKTKNVTLATEIEFANSMFSKARGLMFRSALPNGKSMLFTFGSEDHVGIWMLFMRFPIDLVYLDSRKRIISIYENIKPINLNPNTWKVYYPNTPAKYVLELSQGTVKKTGTELGDILDFD